MIVSLLPPLTDSARMFMALPVSFNRAAVILPLFWGLTLATPGRALVRRLLLGTLLLLPVAFVMVLLYAQFQLALYRTHLPALTETPPADYALALPDSPLAYYLFGAWVGRWRCWCCRSWRRCSPGWGSTGRSCAR